MPKSGTTTACREAALGLIHILCNFAASAIVFEGIQPHAYRKTNGLRMACLVYR